MPSLFKRCFLEALLTMPFDSAPGVSTFLVEQISGQGEGEWQWSGFQQQILKRCQLCSNQFKFAVVSATHFATVSLPSPCRSIQAHPCRCFVGEVCFLSPVVIQTMRETWSWRKYFLNLYLQCLIQRQKANKRRTRKHKQFCVKCSETPLWSGDNVYLIVHL